MPLYQFEQSAIVRFGVQAKDEATAQEMAKKAIDYLTPSEIKLTVPDNFNKICGTDTPNLRCFVEEDNTFVEMVEKEE